MSTETESHRHTWKKGRWSLRARTCDRGLPVRKAAALTLFSVIVFPGLAVVGLAALRLALLACAENTKRSGLGLPRPSDARPRAAALCSLARPGHAPSSPRRPCGLGRRQQRAGGGGTRQRPGGLVGGMRVRAPLPSRWGLGRLLPPQDYPARCRGAAASPSDGGQSLTPQWPDRLAPGISLQKERGPNGTGHSLPGPSVQRLTAAPLQQARGGQSRDCARGADTYEAHSQGLTATAGT